eukprot:2528327-Rhodomonas_salina.1
MRRFTNPRKVTETQGAKGRKRQRVASAAKGQRPEEKRRVKGRERSEGSRVGREAKGQGSEEKRRAKGRKGSGRGSDGGGVGAADSELEADHPEA